MAVEGDDGSGFLLVAEDRLPDLRRGVYAGDVVWTDDGGGGGGGEMDAESSGNGGGGR